MNVNDIIKAKISATVIEYHIPSVSNTRGKMITDASWKRRVLKKDIIAETSPLFKAVKRLEAKMFTPANTNGR